MKIIFATGNKGKLREAKEILGEGFDIISSQDAGITEDIEETGSSFEENSRIKAQYIWDKCHCACFSDDSGLVVDALDGAPGIYSARYAGEGKDFSKNIDKLLHELTVLDAKALIEGKPSPSRKARFVCVVTLILDGQAHCFEGTMEGEIGFERKGELGFGYDPVCIADAFPGQTLAEIEPEKKNSLSHRGVALHKMQQYLASLK